MPGYLIGLDYGTESARGILLNAKSGTIEASHTQDRDTGRCARHLGGFPPARRSATTPARRHRRRRSGRRAARLLVLRGRPGGLWRYVGVVRPDGPSCPAARRELRGLQRRGRYRSTGREPLVSPGLVERCRVPLGGLRSERPPSRHEPAPCGLGIFGSYAAGLSSMPGENCVEYKSKL